MKRLTQEDFNNIADDLFAYATILRGFALVSPSVSIGRSIEDKADSIYALASRIPTGETEQ